MPAARRRAAAFAVIGAGVLMFAVPADATEAGRTDCVTNPAPDQLTATLDATAGTATVRARSGLDLCGDVLLSAYTVPETWDGTVFNKTALPQTLFGRSDRATVAGYETAYLKVALPGCGAVQVDLYVPPEISTVTTTTGHTGVLIKGAIFRVLDEHGKAVACAPASSSASPSPSPSPSPSSSPAPSPGESTTTPAPTPSRTTSTPVPTPSSTGAGPVIPVVPVSTTPAPPAPPVLARTGSNATLPLIGFGAALLGLGIVLSLIGRRRRTA